MPLRSRRSGKARQIGILAQRDASVEDPSPLDLHRIGVVANLLRYVTTPDGTHHLICQGEQRFQIEEFQRTDPYLSAKVQLLPEQDVRTPEIEARFISLRAQALEALQLLPQVPSELIAAIENAGSPSQLADLVAAYIDATPEEKQDILETLDVAARMSRISAILAQRIEVLRLSREISQQTKASLDERQREVLLREQMAAIQRKLGEGDGKAKELAELRDAIAKAGMPTEVEQTALREVKRLESNAGGIGRVRHGPHLSSTGWSSCPGPSAQSRTIDIADARRILDDDHFGLDKVKQRIVEYLAVRKLAPEGKAPILCLVGPPGVGKTSLGQSVAKAMHRNFARVSLGGVHDEAEIRGHRRTYIGAMPGNIIQAIRKCRSRACVMMLDEIDKMGAGIQGDPSAAMLEVLDPEQNSTFRDNYLGVPFDLSRVVFIATANQLDTIPGPLRDRMEIITLAGYTDGEKLEIARRYLLARQLEANGLAPNQAAIDEDAILAIIRGYTREAGVRSLEREIGRVLRRVALEVAEKAIEHRHIGIADLPAILGAPRFEDEVATRTSVPGVATGLAWTPVGGDVLFIEATRFPGKGGLLLTGQLGEVMRESAQAALSLVKTRAGAFGIDINELASVRYPRPYPGRGNAQGRPERRRGHGDGPRIAPHRANGQVRYRHDRRDKPSGLGAAGRRHQGEGGRRRARRVVPRHVAGAQPA